MLAIELRQHVPQRDWDRRDDALARGGIVARHHDRERVEQREQDHCLGLTLQMRLQLLHQVSDVAADLVRCRCHT